MRRMLARWLRALAHRLAPGVPWKQAAWHYRCAMQASNAQVVKQALLIDELENHNRQQRLCIASLLEDIRSAGSDVVDDDWDTVPISSGLLGGKRGGAA